MKQNILADFRSMFDTDYGSLLYLMYECPSSPYFIDGYRSWSEYFVHCKLIIRDKINPLTCLLKDEYMDNADSLYEELCNDHYEDILLLSPQTDIIKLMNLMGGYKGYSISVLCENEHEVSHLHKYRRWNTEAAVEDSYSCFFFHDIDKRLSEAKELHSKTIYIYYHKPNFLNFKEQIPNMSVVPFALTNDFRVIPPYKDLILPKDMVINDMEVPKNGEVYNIK